MPEDLTTIVSLIAASAAVLGLIFSGYRWLRNTVRATEKSIDELKTALKVTPAVMFTTDILVHAPEMHGGIMMVKEGTFGEIQSVSEGFAKVKLSNSTTYVTAPLSVLCLK